MRRFWNSIRPSGEARTGAICAAVAVVIWAILEGALELESGFGLWVDLLFAALVALLGIPVAALLLALVLAILRSLPPVLTGFFAACGLFVTSLWFSLTGGELAAVLLFLECALGSALATVLLGGLRQASVAKRIVTWSILIAALSGNAGILALLRSNGLSEELLKIKQKKAALLTVADPSQRGPYAVKTLFYGSGDSLRRPEFNSSVAIKTKTVDASPFFKDFSGWKAWIRKRYWGFGMDKLPLNAEVFYPQGTGPFPLFVIVHGNHVMSVPSDRGYAYLCELLASRGFIAVSVDENFLNSGLFDDPPKQQAVRGWMLLEHLRLWHEWANDTASPFYRKVDLNEIALAGHSRGGEAAATAALFNKLSYDPDDANIHFHYGYRIRSVIAIAPADGQYKPAEQPRILTDVNYLTLQGSNDSDMDTFDGSRQYDHVHFSGAVPAFKSELYIYRANHGQFNTQWGRFDQSAPIRWFLNARPLLGGDAQRQIAKVYISAFLEATLNGRGEYRDLFLDYRRGQSWLPDTLFVNRYQDEAYKTICSFDEDADLTTTTMPGGRISAKDLTVWREAKIPFRSGDRGYNGVFLGWNRKKGQTPYYEIQLPLAQTAKSIELSVAATDDAPVPNGKDDTDDENNDITDFSLEADGARVTVSHFLLLLPPLHVQFTKLQWLDDRLYKNSGEPVFQTIRIPLSEFHLQQVQRLRIIFDKTPSRVILLSGVGLSK